MPNVTDFLETVDPTTNAYTPVVNQYVRLVNNATAAEFISTAVSSVVGLYSITGVAAGKYTAYYGPTNTGPWTVTSETNYPVVPDINTTAGTIPVVALGASLAGTVGTAADAGHSHGFGKGVPYFDVKAYGAVGDGTTDDTAAVTNAVNALPVTGATLHFPRGTYRLIGAVVGLFSQNSVTISGEGIANTILKIEGNAAGIRVNGVTDCTIRDLTIDCTSQTSGSNAYGIWAPTALRMLVNRVEVKNSYQTGIYGSANVDSAVVFSNIHNCGDAQAVGGGADGVHFQGSTRCKIIGNTIHDNTRTSGHGAAIDDSATTGSIECVIANNTFYNMGNGSSAGGGAVRVTSSATDVTKRTVRCVVMGNTCDLSADSAIWVRADNCVISNNTIYSVTNGYGIELQDGQNGVCVDNAITSIGNEGIILHDGSSSLIGCNGWKIDGNDITFAGTFIAHNRGGIHIKVDSGVGPVKGGSVSRNIITNCGASGILLEGTQGDYVVSGNVCMDNNVNNSGYVGIEIWGNAAPFDNHNTLIVGNRCGDTRSGGSRKQDKGVWLRNATDLVTVKDNDVRNNVTVGVKNDATGTANRINANPGYNPVGVLGPPAIPATTVELVNPYGIDAVVYVVGGTVTVIAVGPSGATSATGMTTGAIDVPAGAAIKLTYSVVPTGWTWIGR